MPEPGGVGGVNFRESREDAGGGKTEALMSLMVLRESED